MTFQKVASVCEDMAREHGMKAKELKAKGDELEKAGQMEEAIRCFEESVRETMVAKAMVELVIRISVECDD